MSTIEIIATAFGLLSVWLTVRQSIWCWPTGLVMVALYAWIFFQAKLYSDMGLQVVYIALCSYGWYYWASGGSSGSEVPVVTLRWAGRGAWGAAGLAGTAGLGYVMATYTDASLPYWDASTTVLSLIAQYLMARKLLESWAFWITVDVLAIGIYFAKDLYLTAGLYAVFLGLATAGLLAWRRSMKERSLAVAAA